MPAKKKSEKQMIAPKADTDCIARRPFHESRADELRALMAQRGIDGQDVFDAVRWARTCK